jgi:hypothetical protein
MYGPGSLPPAPATPPVFPAPAVPPVAKGGAVVGVCTPASGGAPPASSGWEQPVDATASSNATRLLRGMGRGLANFVPSFTTPRISPSRDVHPSKNRTFLSGCGRPDACKNTLMPDHVLKDGESLVTLAKQYGFGKAQSIFDDGGNSALKSKRGHVNALLVGDSVFIPEKKAKTLSLATDQKYKIVVAIPRGVWNLKWSVAKAKCGDKVTLTGETNLPDGNLDLVLKGRELESPKLPKVTVTVKAKKFSFDWTIKDVTHLKDGSPTTAFPDIHIDATTADNSIPCNVATLTVHAVSDAESQAFDAQRSWSGFSGHSNFDQRIERFVNLVDVNLDVMQGWGATYVDLRTAGITGTAGGCPWAGYRWGKPAGAGSMVPVQYHDGKNWVPLPKGFVPSATNYGCVGFYQSGGTFVGVQGGSWPETWDPYIFDSPTYKAVRSNWTTKIHQQWTDCFAIRRVGCASDKSVTCCRYGLTLNIKFTVVTSYSKDVVLFAPGALRSHASLWFMGDKRNMPAHETGHHVDNPDEYPGGAVDPTLQGDGAKNGIDPDCIMGAAMNKTKKRHYHAFVEMTAKLVNGKTGGSDKFEAIDK